jgi:hypothetical protein
MSNKQALKEYFEEKTVKDELFEIEYNGLMHYIESGSVVDLILQTSNEEQELVIRKLRELECKNGDLSSYLRFLARIYVITNV